MKKYRIVKLCLLIGLIFGMFLFPTGRLKAQAAEVIATVQGTVSSETTSDLLYLTTNEGKMQIKLDSTTDTSACKILLPDTKISVSVSSGTDGYLHAVKITSNTQTSSVTVDTSASAVVTGTIDKKTKGDILYFKTPQGEMQIKLDTTTDVSGCSVLIVGKAYQITCARGSDAYMHAIRISDTADTSASAATSAASAITPAPADPSNVQTATGSVTGKVTKNTKENLLCLSTSGGEMQFVIDNNTDTRQGMVLTSGNQLTVSYYRGSDAYLHAVSITGVKGDSKTVTVDTSSPATVTGTVGSKSTQDILYLDTPQGMMELKLDTVNSVTNCKVFVSGKKLTVICAYGSDAYMHAIGIAGV
ncbi:MAG: hypothetical protein Q4C58_02840 [Eubacteriales bacterium]|nr:hypothetical protein [Eubacteriales bacterium]